METTFWKNLKKIKRLHWLIATNNKFNKSIKPTKVINILLKSRKVTNKKKSRTFILLF